MKQLHLSEPRRLLLDRIQESVREVGASLDKGQRERLLCPDTDTGQLPQRKKFWKWKHPLEVFAICWELEAEEAYAAAVPSEEGGCRIDTASVVRTKRHSHDYLELAYVAEGELRQQIQGKEVCFLEGELCLIDRNCIHQDEISGCRGIYLFLGIQDSILKEALEEIRVREQLAGHFLEELLKRKQTYQYLHFRPQPEQEDEICNLLVEILRHLKEDRIGSRYLCRGLSLQLLELLCEKYSVQLLHEDNRHYRKLLYKEVVYYMEAHYARISLGDLVKRFQFQEDYFSRLIREYSGLSYQEYLQGIRLRRAKELVCQSNRRIEEIVATCGYHNKGYFYRLFQERYGMTPAQMRKESNLCQGEEAK